MKVNPKTLLAVTALLLNKLQKSQGEELELTGDYYWSCSGNERYKPYELPQDLTLGQLSDDWQVNPAAVYFG